MEAERQETHPASVVTHGSRDGEIPVTLTMFLGEGCSVEALIKAVNTNREILGKRPLEEGSYVVVEGTRLDASGKLPPVDRRSLISVHEPRDQ